MATNKPELNPVIKRALTRAVKRFKDALTEQALKGKITEEDLDKLDFSKKARQKARDEQCVFTGGLVEGEIAGSSDSEIYRAAMEETQRQAQRLRDQRMREKREDESQPE